MYFQARSGDVLINYENEVILAIANGEKLPYVIPDVNISIDNPVAVVDKTLINTRSCRRLSIFFSLKPNENLLRLASDPLTPRWQKK